jgi:hypothetical protein
VNWYFTAMPMSEVTKNPPLAAYAIALAGSTLGWSERALHLAFVLPALGVVLGTAALAGRLGASPLASGAIVLAAPGFLVSATGLMGDTLMLALWVLAVLAWRTGTEREDGRLFTAAGLLSAASALAKYFGASLLPLLALDGVVRRRRAGRRLLFLLLPAAVLAGYQLWTRTLYGRGLLSDAAVYARTTEGAQAWARGLVALSFTGGVVLPALFLAPWTVPRRWLLALAAGGALAGLALGFGGLAAGGVTLHGPARVAGSVQFAIFVAGGLAVLALAGLALAERRDADTLLLVAWIAGTLAFAGFVNWGVNARSLLPLVPPVAILLARRLGERALWAPIAASGLVALAVAWADHDLAGAARAAAAAIEERTRGSRTAVWFQGHWGFQHYMEAAGARPIDVPHDVLGAGDLVAVPGNNTNTWPLRPQVVASHETLELAGHPFLTVLHGARGAGFYADSFGPLPWSLGRAPAERYSVLTIRDTVRALDAADR